MRVEKIELSGFKSFADRTTFKLHPGITCIVGPNGCGKSNIVDAFKWVLGEQSAKSLRGSRMEEVIFTGSSTRKPKGMSEVSLTVSGLDATAEGKPLSTKVTRRLYRSGESEYVLNGEVCRLRDIRDLFLDTGLELKSYSIFEQDKISEVLSAKPEDRRFLIEEIAGVVKYKVRRKEAQSKLDSSRLNLQRIKDIIAEIRRQINSLDRQVKKAERYKRLMAQLKDVELRIAKHGFEALTTALEELGEEHTALKEDDTIKRAGLNTAENELEGLRLDIVDKEKALGEVDGRLRQTEREVADAERSAAVLDTEVESLRDNIPRIEGELGFTDEKTASSNERLDSLDSRVRELKEGLLEVQKELDGKSRALGADEEEIHDTGALIETRRTEAEGVADALGALSNELGALGVSVQNLAQKEANSKRELELAGEALTATDASISETQSALAVKREELTSLRAEKDALASGLAEDDVALSAIRAELSKAREALASDSSRLKALGEIVDGELPSEIIESLSALSPLADVLEVPKQYERAVESALGELAGGFVTQSDRDAISSVRELRGKEAARTAFIPIEGKNKNSPAAPQVSGLIGRASEFVRAKEGFEHIVKHLLEGVFIVEELSEVPPSGLNDGTDGLLFVTPEGELRSASGAYVGGEGRGVLMKKRQMRELEAGQEAKEARIRELEDGTKDAEAHISEKTGRMGTLNDGAVELEKGLSLLEQSAVRLAEERRRGTEAVTNLKAEREGAASERAAMDAKSAEKSDELRALEAQKTAVQGAVETLTARLDSMKALYEEKRTALFELKLSMNSMREKSEALGAENRAVRALIAELSDKKSSLIRERAATETRIEEKEAEKARIDEALKALVISAGETTKERAARREELETDNSAAAETERTIREMRRTLDPLAERLGSLEVRMAEQRVQRDNLADNVRTNYDVDIRSAETAEPYTHEDDEARDDVRKKIDSLGPVSLGTIEEYEELKERYDFLTKQEEDLEKSIAELEEAISRINSTTKKKLRESFEALKVKFSEVFVRLFGGGQAELILTDESNILETGIDIVAQPPGKRLRNMSLLSGGEKTLTALALLFASFLIKPTPICILDEADASLDEANTEKFARMLRELGEDIQFVVVTHNKVTMEASDFLYGITMEDPGSSKVISLELQEA